MATIIDSLLVRLGLDSQPYKKGSADAARSQKQLKENVKKSGTEIQDSLKATTRQIALLLIGFESIKGAVGFLAGINNADAALGRLAANTGTNVRELNEWALAVELAGGSVDDAKADVTSLASSITDLKATGTVSPLLLLMQRLGVAIFDAEGRTRDLFTIMNEAGAKLRTFNRPDAFQLARGAGLSEGTLNLLLLEEDARRRIFEQAKQNNNMDQAAAERAAKLQREWRDLAQGARQFGRELLETITPAAVAFANAIKPAADSLRSILEGLNNARVGESLATAINGVASAFAFLVAQLPAAQLFVTDMIELLVQLGDKAVEIAANIKEALGGFVDDIRAVASYLFVRPEETAGGDQGSPRVQQSQAAAARRAALFEARQAAQANASGAGAGGTTTVQIDSITVNTQATDAEGIAAELPGALARKGVVAQADTGMN